MKPAYELKTDKPKLLIVDGAGTLFDPGSVIPTYAFQGSFKNAIAEDGKPYGIEVAFSTIMDDMGIDKSEHLGKLLKKSGVEKLFEGRFGRLPNNDDFQRIFNAFEDQLYPSAPKTEEIEGVKEAVYKLKEAGIPLVMTTGYKRRMVDETKKVLPWLDDVLDSSFTSSDVKKGRPYPYMIYRAMESALVENPSYALNVGDTKVDVESSDNAYMPGILVLSGSIINRDEAEKINQELGRRHLVVAGLVEIVNYTLDGTIADRIRELNR